MKPSICVLVLAMGSVACGKDERDGSPDTTSDSAGAGGSSGSGGVGSSTGGLSSSSGGGTDATSSGGSSTGGSSSGGGATSSGGSGGGSGSGGGNSSGGSSGGGASSGGAGGSEINGSAGAAGAGSPYPEVQAACDAFYENLTSQKPEGCTAVDNIIDDNACMAVFQDAAFGGYQDCEAEFIAWHECLASASSIIRTTPSCAADLRPAECQAVALTGCPSP